MERLFTFSIFVVTVLSFHGINNLVVVAKSPQFRAIYQFGDSTSDTGNDVHLDPNVGCGRPPYGQSFFVQPTGRCSNGLLMVDYFAQAFKLPLLSPYLNKSGDFTYGANFAVSGATAMETADSSLPNQLNWFKTLLATDCSNKEACNQKLENALFLVGEIGGNDYNGPAFGGGKNPEDLKSITPKVIQAISDVVTQLIDLGATRFFVPGNFPVGCMTVYLSTYKSNDITMYDELGCLKNWNDLASYHNGQLRIAVKAIEQRYPQVKIVYGDLFSALRTILRDADSLGFDKANIFKACCGAGDDVYNYGGPFCGNVGATTCPDPKVRLSWDGIHLTQHAYQVIADQLMRQFIPKLLS